MIKIKDKDSKENEQIYIRAFMDKEVVVNSDCGIAMDKLYDLIKADMVVKE